MQKIILAGFGFMGTMHAQVYSQLKKARVAAVVDTNRRVAAAAMAKLGVNAPLFGDLASALKAVEADAVDICLPTPRHAPAALEAIAAGKHIFCEKPLALTLADAERITSAAKRAKVFAQVGQCIRFWPEYVAFRDFVASGRAGALRSLSLQRRSGLPMHSVEGWLINPGLSGGAAIDLHIHDTDFVISLLGTPKAVSSAATIDTNGPSHIFTSYTYKGIPVVAEGGWNYPLQWGFQMAFQAVFERGAVEYDSGTGLFLTLGKQPRRPMPFKAPSVGASTTGAGNISSLGGYFNELQYFVNCLETNTPPAIATLAQAKESLRVVLAEVASARSGKPVNL
jgi:predicted dehydrogenase